MGRLLSAIYSLFYFSSIYSITLGLDVERVTQQINGCVERPVTELRAGQFCYERESQRRVEDEGRT